MLENLKISKRPAKNWLFLFLLILAGESVFILPFVLSRVFRPTVLDVFQIDNLQLGYCFSVYGIVALFSYLLGGPLADKYPPRKLIAIALWMTSIGGLIYATFPGYTVLKVLYAYWGFTTIFLFWAPMIKATRIWGGTASQGKAFGFLDGGRGLTGALFGALGVLIFSFVISSNTSTHTISESKAAFMQVILVSSGIVATVGFLVWFYMKLDQQDEKQILREKITFENIKQVLRLKSVWLLMIIILCAYVGYKITDIFSLYARDVMHYDQVDSARVGTFLLFIRPCIGVLIGVIADRSKPSVWLTLGFLVSLLGALSFALNLVEGSTSLLFLISVLIIASGVYAARSLYFAVMESGRIPLVYTGTAVGLISLAGFTPDIFAGLIIGYLLENSPGAKGHQHVFWMLAIFSLFGGITAWYYHYTFGKQQNLNLQ